MSASVGKTFLIGTVKLGVTVLVAAGLAQLTWYLLEKFSIIPATAPVAMHPPTPPIAAAPAPTPSPMPSANRPATPPPPPRRTPGGNDDLVLTGIIETGEKGGVAVMRVNNQPETAFSVGQQILPSIVLHAVMSNRVIIMNDGVLESLTLTGKRTQLTLPADNAAAAAIDSISMRADNHFLVPHKLIETSAINPQALLSQSAVVPLPDGGLLIKNIDAGSIYEKLGVRAGDIVRSANDRPLATIQDAMQIYYDLQNHGGTGDVRLEIQRKGEPLYLQYTVQ